MPSSVVVRSLACLLVGLAALEALAEEAAFQPVKIEVPPEFEVTLAAAPPLVAHPLMAGFDDQGRLYVAENAGLNLDRKELERQKPNSIVRLEDTDGDGVFDRRTVFADQMTFPQGALWHGGSLYVASPPHIWKLTDTNDDGVADVREAIVGKFGYTGNAADIHGCFLGPDGRIYWCDGRHGHEFIDAEGNVASRGKAARIFSCREDGSDVRVHCGGGMDNPVEIDFLPSGDMLGTVNLMYMQRGDCLVHWLRGGVYPREDQQQCIDEFPYTGGLLGPAIDYGHVAVSGMTRYRSAALDPTFRDQCFVTQFNTHKVVRSSLERDGSTWRASVHEFAKGLSDDFHPTDVLEDADGSLLVIDTGGWFRIGCPTSQIAKPNILGAIYRIRRRGAPAIDDPRGRKLAWDNASAEELVARLDDPRFAVRERAIAELAARGEAAMPALAGAVADRAKQSPLARLSAVWALCRIATAKAHESLRAALDDPDEEVRQAAAYSLGVTRDRAAAAPLIKLLAEEASPAVKRSAATALGELGDKTAVAPLLRALDDDTDRSLEHAVIDSLVRIDAWENAPHLAGLAPRQARAALIARDQSKGGNLPRDELAALLASDDPALLAEVIRIFTRRPEWAGDLEARVLAWLKESTPDDDEQRLLRGALAALGERPTIQAGMKEALARAELAPRVRSLILRAIAAQKEPSPAWREAIARSLRDADAQVLEAAIAAARQQGVAPFQAELWELARNAERPVFVRLQAMEGATSGTTPLSADDFAFLMRQQSEEVEPLTRVAAARVLAAARLSDGQLEQVRGALAAAGPLEIGTLAGAFEKSRDPKLLTALVRTLKDHPHRGNVDLRWLRKVAESDAQELRTMVDEFDRERSAQLSELRARIDQLLAKAPSGDAERGAKLFTSQRAGCSACHRIGDRGGRIGPDLSTIGARRSPRDLIEAIVVPSASLARGYESYVVITEDGRSLSGTLVQESSLSVTLQLSNQAQQTIARKEIESLEPSPVSLMPAGLDRTMTDEELCDLVAYLSARK